MLIPTLHGTPAAPSSLPWGEAPDRLVFPRRCLVCDGYAMRVGLCDMCRRDLLGLAVPACAGCAAMEPDAAEAGWCQNCGRGRYSFDTAVAVAPYEGAIRHLCLRLKDARSAWLSVPLAELLLAARRREIEGWLSEAHDPLVVPVPLHWWRQFRRGFNQAEALAGVLASRLCLRLCNPLRRVRHTPKLVGLTVSERALELRAAFAARTQARALVGGRDILLVDDIMTTGATCSSAAQTLKQAGARRVLVGVIARAVRPAK